MVNCADLLSTGKEPGWRSTENGGEANVATPEKGRMLFEEAVKNLIAFTEEWTTRPRDVRVDHHVAKPLSGLPG